MNPIRVTIWNELVHEQTNPAVARVYPQGIHGALASARGTQPRLQVRTATLREPEHGLTEEVLAQTDVLTWWGHAAHDEVSDTVVARVHQRIIYNAVLWARPQGAKSDVPRHVPVEQARERITVRGLQMHDASGALQ